MAEQVFTTWGAWTLALLLYPGLLFLVALALAGEWLAAGVRPLFVPRINRMPVARHVFLQPVYDALKLAGRLPSDSRSRNTSGGLGLVSIAAPLLATLLMPVPGSLLVGRGAGAFDLFSVLVLLAIQPVVGATVRLRGGGLPALRGGQDLGRLITGLLPALLSVAALAEVASSRSLQLASLTAAPESAPQAIVRLLAGAVLLLALPWWVGSEVTVYGVGGEQPGAGRMFQRAALAALWAVLALPLPGDLPWAVAVIVPGAIVAYMAMRLIPSHWAQGRSEAGLAGLLWSATVPAALVALVVALWSGA